jgi:Domain of Unknown Function with PDB structure (DUF3857)/Transglutaminase-like superfamily
MRTHRLIWILLLAASCASPAFAGSDAPQWMHALVNAPIPTHDEKTDAVKLYSETTVSVQSEDKIKRTVRVAYKILRPSGRHYGEVFVHFNSSEKISNLRGWCIPASGKDFEVKEKEGAEVSLPKIEGSELVSDVKAKFIAIPAADPGNIVGYEYEAEEHPLVLQDVWDFQAEVPSRESHYTLQLPAGWAHKSAWLNYPEVKPTESGSQLQWAVSDLKAIRPEEDMPPIQGLAGLMVVSFFPQGGSSSKSFTNWQQMGQWYVGLTNGRSDASPEINQKVTALTASSPNQLAKMRAIAQFVQHDIRYVAIELGIGGWQPHYAAEVFTHRYGDCKDKATLMRSMLHEIGVEAYHVPINTERGSITPDVPAYQGFDHVIIAIKLPDDVSDKSLTAIYQHPKLGRLLFFDPTNELTPFGQIGGYLQDNFGLLVSSDGGELVKLPHQAAEMNGITRTAKLSLEGDGTLKGDVTEFRVGDRAWTQRWALRTVRKESDRIKPIENLLAGSLSSYRITKALLVNLEITDLPFGYKYSFQSDNYAKTAGNLILVRPRVMGSKSQAILETKDPRVFPIEFEGPVRDTDSFEIALPQGYEVDDVPPPVDADYSFASYHSKTEVKGNVIAYTRTFEVKELSVPPTKADELKKFYRIIASDERNTAVLKPAAK